MYVFNKEVRHESPMGTVLDIIPVWCESCGRTIFPKGGVIPTKCPSCGKMAWEE